MTLPALGETVTEGTVTRWLKQVGDTVAADEPLVEVSTDKVDTEIPSPAAGVVLVDQRRRGRDRRRSAPSWPSSAARVGCRTGSAPAAPATGSPLRPAPSPLPAAGRPPPPRRCPGARRAGPRASPRPLPRLHPRARRPSEDERGRRDLRHPAGPQARRRARRRPRHGHRHRRRRPDPQAGRPRRRRARPRRLPQPPAAAAAPSRARLPAAAAAAGLAAAWTHREDVAPAHGHRRADGRVAAGLGAAHHASSRSTSAGSPRCGSAPRASSRPARA